MRYEPKVSVAEELAVVIVPKGECNDFNKELRALRKRLEKDCKPYNNSRRRFAKKRHRRIETAPVCDSSKWYRYFIPLILVLAAFTAGDVLRLDCGSLDKLLYILAAYSQMVASRSNKTRKSRISDIYI
jgi:hypothetical protein